MSTKTVCGAVRTFIHPNPSGNWGRSAFAQASIAGV
jgi:hypothetical protein